MGAGWGSQTVSTASLLPSRLRQRQGHPPTGHSCLSLCTQGGRRGGWGVQQWVRIDVHPHPHGHTHTQTHPPTHPHKHIKIHTHPTHTTHNHNTVIRAHTPLTHSLEPLQYVGRVPSMSAALAPSEPVVKRIGHGLTCTQQERERVSECLHAGV